jgi:hypothetical protein
MKRTNIYLGEEQSAALDVIAHAQGVSRAEVIRVLLDRELHTASPSDLETDLNAIEGSFGVLADDDFVLDRGPDARAAHLDDVARR